MKPTAVVIEFRAAKVRALEAAARELAEERAAFLRRVGLPRKDEDRKEWARLSQRRLDIEAELGRLAPMPPAPPAPRQPLTPERRAELLAMWRQMLAQPRSCTCKWCGLPFPAANRRRHTEEQLRAELAGFCWQWCQEVHAAALAKGAEEVRRA